MQLNFFLDKRSKSKKGFPIKVTATHKGKQKMKSTGYFSAAKDWSGERIKKSHPQYYALSEELSKLESKMRAAEFSHNSLEAALDHVFKEHTGNFTDAAKKYLDAEVTRNKEHGLNAINSFPNLEYSDVTETVVKEYLTTRLNKGYAPNGINSYLRHLSTLWDRTTPNGTPNPFKGIRAKKKTTPNKIYSLPELQKIAYTRTIPTRFRPDSLLEVNSRRYVWMLMFYLGGIDLFDLYQLRYDKNVRNGRIEFNRGKGGTDVFVSNKILPQAQEILDIFDCKPYLIPQAGNYRNYQSKFVSRFDQSILDLELSMRPYLKAARYSFINRAKELLIDERIVKEIVGHSDQSVHSIYTGNFTDAVRDEAHTRIIEI